MQCCGAVKLNAVCNLTIFESFQFVRLKGSRGHSVYVFAFCYYFCPSTLTKLFDFFVSQLMPPKRKSPRKVESSSEETPPKRNKAAHSPPAKKNKGGRKKFYYFKMKGDMKDAFLEGDTMASAHRKEYAPFIVKEKTFTKKAEFETFKRRYNNPVLNPPQVRKETVSENANKVDQLVSMMKDDQDIDCFRGFWKTTSTSSLCLIMIRVMNQYGTETWVWNPTLYAEIFRNYAKVMDIADPLLFEALSNMTTGKASNPDSPDKNKPLITLYSPKDEPSKSFKLDISRCFTYITIPVDSLSSFDEETHWCENAVDKVLGGIRDMMSDAFFRAALERIGQTRSSSYIQKLFDPSKKTNLPKFLASAVIKTKPVVYPTDHVIQAVSNEIMTRFWENSLEKPKYGHFVEDDTEESDPITSEDHAGLKVDDTVIDDSDSNGGDEDVKTSNDDTPGEENESALDESIGTQ